MSYVDNQNVHGPQNYIEKQLLDIWSKILDTVVIDTQTDFYQIGGTSVNTIHLVMEIQKDFDEKINVFDVFNNSTVEKLGRLIESRIGETQLMNYIESKPDIEVTTPFQKRMLSLGLVKNVFICRSQRDTNVQNELHCDECTPLLRHICMRISTSADGRRSSQAITPADKSPDDL